LTGTGPQVAVREDAGVAVRDLAWIDDFFRSVRGHVFARAEDGVLILPPNQVFRLNEGGQRIVGHLLAGRPIARLPGIADGERARQVQEFCADFRDFYQGDSSGLDARASVERVPYTFDFTRLPILGEIAVTYACNNACLFCYAGCGGAGRGCGTPPSRTEGTGRSAAGVSAETPEMTLSEVKRIIDVFQRDAQIPFFSFTGGEPLLRPDLEAMIGHARRRGLEVNLVTNGTLANRTRARSLARAGLRTAQVSVEAPDAATHDRLTARSGSFDLTLAGIRNLRAAGISVQTNTTITAVNAHLAPRMPAFLKSLGITRFAMNLYIPGGSTASRTAADPGADPLFFPYSRIGPTIDAVRAAARAEGLVFYWYSPTPHCLYNPIARGLGNKSCAAMDGLLSVSPSGDVLPCSSYPKPMGNLLRDGFRAIWFSPEARHFKRKEYAPAECVGCESFRACQAACPLYWSRAGTAEIRNPSTAGREAARVQAAAGR